MSNVWTEEKKEAARIPTTLKPCKQCGIDFLVRMYGKGSNRTYCSTACYQHALKTNNHMKRPEMRALMSSLASLRTKEAKEKIGRGVSLAWRLGKFADVRTGRCNWYAFEDSAGVIHKVQGTWELAFVYWLDNSGLQFQAHQGWVRYIDSFGKTRYWYPDFFVKEWNEFVDVKADHFYNPEKFKQIRKHNPDMKVRVLLREDLKQLGVLIYGKGNKYLPYLEELIQKFRVQPGAKEQYKAFFE